MTIKEVKTTIEKLQKSYEAEKSDMERKINTAEKVQSDALKAATAAYDACDINAFHSAQDQKRAGDDSAAMYKKKLAALLDTPLISVEEYNQMVCDVMAEMKDMIDADRGKIRKLIEEVESLAKEECTRIEEANALLHTIQHEIYKDDACMETATGKRIPMPHLEKRFDDYSIVGFNRQLQEIWSFIK